MYTFIIQAGVTTIINYNGNTFIVEVRGANTINLFTAVINFLNRITAKFKA